MRIFIPQYRVRQCLALLMAAAVFFLAGTSVYHQWGRDMPMGPKKQLLVQLSLAFENVAAAWFSSMLLLLAAVLSLAAFFSDRQQYRGRGQQAISAGWLFVALVFALLSFDEMGSVHETIGDSALFHSAGGGNGWGLFTALVLVVGGALAVFGWMRLRRVPLALVLFVTGVLLYLSNGAQENYEIASMNAAADPSHWKRPLLFLLLEEGSELAGSLCFIGACVVYLKKLAGRQDADGLSVFMGREAGLLNIIFWGGVLAGAALLVLWRGETAHQTETGIARNWFPSALSFLLFVAAVYGWGKPRFQATSKTALALVALLSLGFSVAAGIDVFGQQFAQGMAFKGFMAAVCLGAFLLLVRSWRPAQRSASVLFLVLWLLFTAGIFFLQGLFTPLFLYLGTACLAGALAAQLSSPNRVGP